MNRIPLPSIAEADATGEITDLYADIRQTLDMSFVNMIWRVLAAIPGGLAFSWGALKPLYEGGQAYAEARALEESLVLPSIPRLPTDALRAVGVSQDDERAIRAALDGYRRGNPLNTVTFSALQVRLRDESPSSTQPLPAEPRPGGSPYGDAPRLMNFDEMSPLSASWVRRVNLLGAADADVVQVSLPRNLAPWPGYLALYWTLLAPLHADGRLRSSIDEILADGRERGKRLVAGLGSVEVPAETQQAVLKVLDDLVPNAMVRMIPVVGLLIDALPQDN